MKPVLFQWHSVTLYTYGFFVAIAMVAVFLVAGRRARAVGLPQTVVADLIFLLFVSGVIGARAFYVLQHGEQYRADWTTVFAIREGGLVWYGGFLVAACAGIAYARWRHWPVLKLCDFFAPLVPLAHGIGRFGCFFNGCCYGRDGIPVQLIEAAALFLLSAGLFSFASRKHREGEVLVLYVAGYAAVRFFTEFLRGDQTPVGFLTLPQWTSALLFAGALVFGHGLRRR